MKKVEIEQRVFCECPEFEGYQDLVDCKDCDYHEGIENDRVKCTAPGRYEVKNELLRC